MFCDINDELVMDPAALERAITPRTRAIMPVHWTGTMADMPAIGFGTSYLGDCGEIVASALSLGYRHIDTAWKYGTERGVGEGIRASGVPRNEIFLTTKVSHEYLRADDFARSVEQSLLSTKPPASQNAQELCRARPV